MEIEVPRRPAVQPMLTLARQRLLATMNGPRKALIASNPGGGLPLMEMFSRHTSRELPNRGESAQECFATLLDDFLLMVHSGQTEHGCDVSRGLHIQKLLQTITYMVGGSRLGLPAEPRPHWVSDVGPDAAAASR